MTDRGAMQSLSREPFDQDSQQPSELTPTLLVASEVPDGAVFPGTPESMAGVRAYVREAVAEHGPDIADNAELLATEIATNAVIHSWSGEPGGHITVMIIIHDRTVRVQVLDEGTDDSVPLLRADGEQPAEHGHGLVLVKNLAARWGTEPTGDGGRLTWFELDAIGRSGARCGQRRRAPHQQ